LTLARRSELILATGWTFEQLDSQDSTEVARFETYLRMKNAVAKSEAED
jgi:hypothetical protein